MIERMMYYLSRARKPFLLFLLTIVFFLSVSWLPRERSAVAESIPTAGDYACILNDGVYFYHSPDEKKGLFLLPKSYYVRLVEYGAEFCKVEYQRNEGEARRLVGYAKTKELTFVNYVPARPYLYYVFDVTYTIDDAEENSSFLNQITVSCVYYGDYRVGSESYCYVLRGTEFGYIPKPSGLSYEKNNEYADYLASLTPPPSQNTETPIENAQATPMQIAILIVICLLVPILAAFILKPPKKPTFDLGE